MLEHDGVARLGQVLDARARSQAGTELDLPADGDTPVAIRSQLMIRHARGSGVLLEGDGTPVHDATVRPATAAEVRAWRARDAPRRASLAIGELADAPGVPCTLDAGGFDRHTFLCGQSGSGKTYALGVLLEQLLLETELRIIILDPNSDFVRLATVRPDVDADTAARYAGAAKAISVHSAQRHGRPAPAAPARGTVDGRPGRAAAPGPDRGPRGACGARRAAGRGRAAHRCRAGGVAASGGPAAGAPGPQPRGRALRPVGGRRARLAPSMRSTIPRRAASSSTSARWARARSRRSPPRRCSAGSGSGARSASRS